MWLRLLKCGQLFELPDQPFQEGREGKVFEVTVPGRGRCAFKMFKEPGEPTSRKLRFMLEHPPALVSAGANHLAWPVDIAVNEAGEVLGYLMPFVPGTSLAEYYGQASLVLRLRLALNIARVIESLHESGYIVGDMHDDNILANDDGTVTIVDCDSFQIGDFPCLFGRPDFLAPELLAVSDLSLVRRTFDHDCWSLATIVFLLLMQCHPFRAIYTGTDGATLGLMDKVAGGHWPYSRNARLYVPPPDSPPFDALPQDIQSHFRRAFELGHGNSSQRPIASVWKWTLMQFDHQLMQEVSLAQRTTSSPRQQAATTPAQATSQTRVAVPVTSNFTVVPRWTARVEAVFGRVCSVLVALKRHWSLETTKKWYWSAIKAGRSLWAKIDWRRWLCWELIGVVLVVVFLLLWWWIKPVADRETPTGKPEGKSPPAFFQESR